MADSRRERGQLVRVFFESLQGLASRTSCLTSCPRSLLQSATAPDPVPQESAFPPREMAVYSDLIMISKSTWAVACLVCQVAAASAATNAPSLEFTSIP